MTSQKSSKVIQIQVTPKRKITNLSVDMLFLQAGAAITWRSTKQDIVAQSSAEAEYIALGEAAKEALWIRKLQQEIFPNIKVPTIIHEDNNQPST